MIRRYSRRAAVFFAALPLATLGVPAHAGARPVATASTAAADQTTVHYRSMRIDGAKMFYREAGPQNAPVLLLLHGFPTSSRMFRNLIPALADRYHIIAPDYPGFGQSEAPADFAYSFAHFAEMVDTLMTNLKLDRYALFVQDYGAPVGYRLALRHPERVTALIVQNGNAYTAGLSPFWDPIRAYWADGSEAHRNALRAGLTPAATQSQYYGGVADATRIDPEVWQADQHGLDRPGADRIMLDLFYDYRTNVALYPEFQAFFRNRRPPTLIAWGANDPIFPAAGAHAYLRDLPDAELHLLDSGHFALEDKGNEIAALMRDFLGRTHPAAPTGQ